MSIGNSLFRCATIHITIYTQYVSFDWYGFGCGLGNDEGVSLVKRRASLPLF